MRQTSHAVCKLCLAFALVAMAPAGWAETLRVATWSFPADADAGPLVDEAALVLKKLNPDVILLERVRDWDTCNALAQALKPGEYSVLVCSAFRSATNATAAASQVAILSKYNGYFSWSEPWRVEGEPAVAGGFAFAAIRSAKHRVGFVATQVAPQVAGTNASADAQAALRRQWAQTFDSFKSWVTNRLEAVVVVGGAPAPDAAEAAASLRFLSAPFRNPVTLSPRPKPANATNGVIPVRLAANAKALPGLVLLGAQTACALNLDPPKTPVASPKAPATNAIPSKVPTTEAAPAKALSEPVRPRPAATNSSSAPAAATPSPRSASAKLYPYWVLGGAVVVLLPVLWLWARRRRAPQAAGAVGLPGNGLSSYTLIVSQPSLAHSATPAAVQPVLPRPGPRPSAPGPVEVWPPGPVLLTPELPRAAASERAGLRLHLAQWLKQKLVQRLLADRSEMLKTQQTATVKLLSFEARLAKLERQLQQQNRAYEQRILELNRDLAAAKEENRELIRARIAQVKAEMELARARLLAQARAGER